MRLLRRRQSPQPDIKPDPQAAERDLAQAERELEAAKAQTDYYRDLGTDLGRIRTRNHLAESFLNQAARGRRA